jgi:hypothetical protein
VFKEQEEGKLGWNRAKARRVLEYAVPYSLGKQFGLIVNALRSHWRV